MTNITIVLAASILVSLGIGLMVLLTNFSRTQNRAFFVLAVSMSTWGGVILLVMNATTEAASAWYIRWACFVAVQMPLAFHLHCLSIVRPEDSIHRLLHRIRYHVIANQLAGLIAFTDLLMTGVTFATGPSGARVISASQGPLFIPFHIYVLTSFLVTVGYFTVKSRVVDGIRKAELQYTLLGMSVAVIIVSITNIYIPLVSKNSGSEPYAPICLLALNGIIAYGIATRKLMDVSTVLQRMLAYGLLATYLVVLYMLVLLLTGNAIRAMDGNPDILPHLLAALVLAFSMTPVQGVLQQLSQKLFINTQTWDIEDAVKSGSELFASITTMNALIARFKSIVADSGIDPKSIRLMFPKGSVFLEHDVEAGHHPLAQINANRPLIRMLRRNRAPINAYSMKRVRSTPSTQGVEQDLEDHQAELALGLYFKNELRGIVLMGARISGRIYSATNQDSLQVLCDQFAVALENASLYTEVQNNKIYNDILVDNLVSGVVAVDRDGVINVINREAQRIIGLSGADALGKSAEVLPSVLAETLRSTLDQQINVKDQEVSVQGKLNGVTPVHLGSSVFSSSTGDPLGALVVFADLTEQKKLETQVRRSDRLASIGTLSAGMAHEIKNPLVTIKTFTELLPERYQDDDFRETFSSLVSQEVQRIDRIVNQLLHFARPVKADLKATSLHEILDNAMQLMQEQCKNKSIQAQMTLDAEEDTIHADADLLMQAFINFLFNAIDSMEPNGALSVCTTLTTTPSHLIQELETDTDEPYVLVTVSDTGSGIAAASLSQVFDPFFTTKSHGTGLGLSIAHGIINEHNGLIDVESQLGAGTTFSIFFPLVRREMKV